MAQPNYSRQKFQKELKRKKKQEEKRLRRLEKSAEKTGEAKQEENPQQ